MTYTTRFGAAHLAALLLLLSSVYTPSVAAQTTTCADLSGDARAVMCTVPSGSEYVDCIHHRDAVVAAMRRNINAQTPPQVLATIDAAAAYDCISDTSAAASLQPPMPDPVAVAPTTATDPPATSPPGPADGFDITGCMSTDAINTLLGWPTTYSERGGPGGADFKGPGGATLSMDHYASQTTTGFTDLLEGFKRSGSQIVPIDGLGDQAFAVNRGGDGRSLVVLQGDQLWLVSMDGVPPERGFPQMAELTRGMLQACP